MTYAALTALRNVHTAMADTRTRTAREMALQPHNLNRDASIATEPDGTRWTWVGLDETGHWARTA